MTRTNTQFQDDTNRLRREVQVQLDACHETQCQDPECIHVMFIVALGKNFSRTWHTNDAHVCDYRVETDTSSEADRW
jgi:hypothetical protein